MFFESFAVIIVLVVIVIVCSIIYAVFSLFKSAFSKRKREKQEQEVLKIADTVSYYQENKNLERVEHLLRYVNLPKNMKMTEEDDEIILTYFNLKYNVNKGRFILNI
jgi:uncharacterized membrane protein YvbJ